MNPDFDDYDDVQRDDTEPLLRGNGLTRLILVLAIVGFLGLTYYAYHSGTQSVTSQQIPFIEADSNPVKAAPEEAGGEVFANKDKTIYDAISPYTAESSKKVEKLLPTPEQPKIPEDLGTRAVSQDAQVDSSSDTTSYVKTSPQTQSSSSEDKEATGYNLPSETEKDIVSEAEIKASALKSKVEAAIKSTAIKPVVPAETSTTAPAATSVKASSATISDVAENIAKTTQTTAQKTAESAAKPIKKAALTPVAKTATPPLYPASASGNHKIQLGAFQSEAEAQQTWQRIRSKYSDVLSQASVMILRAELATGTYYRLRATGFASVASAKAACESLMARKQPCFYAGQ